MREEHKHIFKNAAPALEIVLCTDPERPARRQEKRNLCIQLQRLWYDYHSAVTSMTVAGIVLCNMTVAAADAGDERVTENRRSAALLLSPLPWCSSTRRATARRFDRQSPQTPGSPTDSVRISAYAVPTWHQRRQSTVSTCAKVGRQFRFSFSIFVQLRSSGTFWWCTSSGERRRRSCSSCCASRNQRRWRRPTTVV